MAAADAFAGLIGPVAEHLLGKPNVRLSKADDLRFGNHGSLSIRPSAGTWFDHEAQEGGGVLDLIARETGAKNGGAVEWLKEQGFDVPDDGRRPAPAARAPARAQEASSPGERRELEAVYDYVDEQGSLLYQAVRYVFRNADGSDAIGKDGKRKKTFLQRRPAGPDDDRAKAKDGYVWSLKGVRLVPYRLPDLLEALAQERPIFIVEGEKKVDRLAELGVPATCNPMGAGKWPADFGPLFAGADVVLLADNDDAGRKHRDVVGASLKEHAARIRELDLPGLSPKEDVVDWLDAGGSADGLYALVERQARPWTGEQARTVLPGIWFADIDQGLNEPEWLVDDILTRGDSSEVFGASQSGKSFLATHFGMAIARGEEVFGRRVKQGGVVYIAAEGKRGFKQRLKAYRQHFGIDRGQRLPFILVPVAVDLFAREGDIDRLCSDLPVWMRQIADLGSRLELVVVDTYAATTPGANENASEHVSVILKNHERIKEVSKAHLMVVHHKNAAGDKPRGHTSLYAGADNAIEVNRDEATNDREFIIRKLKDAPDGEKFGFRLQPVTIGARDDGKPITSCVVVPAQAGTARTSSRGRRSDQDEILLRSLRIALGDHGEPAPGALGLPYGVRVVRAEHVKRGFLGMAFDEPPSDEAFRQALKRSGDRLVARGIIGRNAPYLWIVREPEGRP